MKRFVIIACLLALPLTASAQTFEEQLAMAWWAWDAAVEMGAPNGEEGYWGEVCWGCDEIPAQVVQHALLIAQKHGVQNTWGFDAATKYITNDPQGREVCNEDENWFWSAEFQAWINRCWTSGTMRPCYSQWQIDHQREMMYAARQISAFYGGAAIFAGALNATRPFGLVFSGISLGFNYHANQIGSFIEHMGNSRCVHEP